MGGLTWSLINDPQHSGHFLEYGSKGIYDPVRRKVRYHGGADPGYSQCLEYDEATNQWSWCQNAHRAYTDHGWDNNAVDPSTGEHYVFESRTTNFRRWNGSAWSSIANDTQCLAPLREPMVGLTWDSDRGGLIQFTDSGVCFWNKSTNTWTYLGQAPGVTASYHFTARHHPKARLVWLQDGNNGSRNHWKLDLNGQITKLRAAPLDLGCCGAGGVLSTYDYGSEKFIVADPFANRWFEYDIVTDTWRQFTTSLPLDNGKYDTSNVEGIVVPISTYGVILYVMARGTGSAPQAFLYKHAR
jgi:hypothetical protein